MRTIQKKIKVSKGMISPDLSERTDLSILDESALMLENYTATIYGGFRTRRGTKFIGNDVGKVYSNTATVNSSLGDTTHIFDDIPFVSNTIGTNRTVVDFSFENQNGATISLSNIFNAGGDTIESRQGSGTVTLNGVYDVLVVGAGAGSLSNGWN